mgnify:CR=1 FL=1
MKKLLLGYLVIGFLLIAGIGFGYRAMQYDQTLESSNKHMSYLNRLSSKDFVTEEQIKTNLDYIKKINELELRFYRSLNEIIKSVEDRNSNMICSLNTSSEGAKGSGDAL